MNGTGLDWDTRTVRSRGIPMRVLNTVVPGVRRVRAQVQPYAQAWAEHDERVAHDPRRRWVVLGDSMSQGIGASAHDAGWVGQLARRLRICGHDLAVLNLAANGARTADVTARQLPLLEHLPAQPGGTLPPLVTVLVGSNDLFAGRQSRAALPDDMGALVAALPAGSVVATLPQPTDVARAANARLEAAAARGHVRLLDLRTAGPTSWRGRLASDFFHPNDAGYTAMADAFEPVVLGALEPRPH